MSMKRLQDVLLLHPKQSQAATYSRHKDSRTFVITIFLLCFLARIQSLFTRCSFYDLLHFT